jgi:hypothetical protein
MAIMISADVVEEYAERWAQADNPTTAAEHGLGSGAAKLTDQQREWLFRWARHWARNPPDPGRPQACDRVDLAAAFGLAVGFTCGRGVAIIPAIRLLKAALGGKWPRE